MVGEASNGLEAIRLYRATQPHVTLMDVQMPEFNGIAAISSIMAEFPQLRVAVLMAYRGDVIALQAIKARAAIFRKAHCAMNSLKPYACWRPVNSTSPRRSRRNFRFTSIRTVSPTEKFRSCNMSPMGCPQGDGCCPGNR